MIVIIDNYDSFTYNLAHSVKELGAETDVLRKRLLRHQRAWKIRQDHTLPRSWHSRWSRIAAWRYPYLCRTQIHPWSLSWRTGYWSSLRWQTDQLGRGFSRDTDPIRIGNDELPDGKPVSNKQQLSLASDYLFSGLPSEILVGRYHSWVVDTEDFPEELAITALSPEGQIMALKHRTFDIHGIQFHPESILTPDGKTILRNWIAK